MYIIYTVCINQIYINVYIIAENEFVKINLLKTLIIKLYVPTMLNIT